MRTPLIAGNWKMNLHWDEAMTLIAELTQEEKERKWTDLDVAIFPPAIYTRHAFEYLRNTKSGILLGLQNCAATENGAFTGELSASMVKALGATAVLIGHSERRSYFGETDALLLLKLRRALDAGLVPFYCCGEVLEDRKNSEHFHVVQTQLEDSVLQLTAQEVGQIVIAYEPVWAIGTGETASPQQAQEMHAFIRQCLANHFGPSIASQIRILYGGSMKPNNAAELMAQPDVDGGLIGGASLNAADFSAIVEAAL
jgi:triosephosphate isomerase